MNRYVIGKNIVFFVTIIFVGASVVPSLSGSIGGVNQDNENIRITVENNNDIVTISYQISEFLSEELSIDGNEYLQLTLDEESNIMFKGKPELPNICRSIIVPDALKMEVRVTQSKYQEYVGINIIPSKGHLPRTVNPEDIPYKFDEIYKENKWFPEKIVELREPYIVRDFRGLVIEINPFQYNPVEEKLRFYNDISVEVYPDGVDSINTIIRDEFPQKIDAEFMQIYTGHFINIDTIFNNQYTPVEEQGNMLVITYDSFWDSMVPFVQWKNMKGIPTEMVNVSTIGDASAIKTYIENYYNNNGLTFVLLVGDAAQVPTLYISPYASSATDPSYSYIVGNDNYQDLFIGRFSAQNIDQLETQVERSIEYERYPQSGADWYHKGIGVASNQGPGDDGEYDDEHMDNIRDDLLSYTYTEVGKSYDPTGSSTIISDAINDGLSIANYCGHGSPTSWGNGGGFNNNDVNALVNDNMLPFITSVACNNGQFDDYDPCFAEAWLRATNNGEPTGAIGVFASTQSQSWNPPMDAQDEIVDILIETYEDNIRTTYGALCFEGTMHMMDEYGSGCYDETDTWTIFGDPSLQVRTDTPSDMTVTHGSIIPIGSTTFGVEVEGIENALCAISHDYELLGYGYTDETGYIEINFSEPMSFFVDGVDLVVTAYNKIPYNTSVQTGNSYPPEPPTINGPVAGKPEKEYEYTMVTTDPEEDPIFYLVEWGDGDSKEWFGPYSSGQTVTVSHAWSEIGNYEIKAMAKDDGGAISDWSEPYPVEIDLPVLDIIDIEGGLLKITAEIENTGIAEAEEINWKITLDGGFILMGKETTGSIDIIESGEKENITSGMIFGLGPTRVYVTVEMPEGTDERDQGGYILLFFIRVNPGGS
jgi:hypothetical protein